MPFSRLQVEKITGESCGRQKFILAKPLRFTLSTNGGRVGVTVPAGFVTDFASVPRPLWPIFPPAGAWCEAAVVHDYLYSSKACSRFLADALFRECMAHCGVPVWRRMLMYYAVRVFGRRHKRMRRLRKRLVFGPRF
jgi:hypothetical protein